MLRGLGHPGTRYWVVLVAVSVLLLLATGCTDRKLEKCAADLAAAATSVEKLKTDIASRDQTIGGLNMQIADLNRNKIRSEADLTTERQARARAESDRQSLQALFDQYRANLASCAACSPGYPIAALSYSPSAPLALEPVTFADSSEDGESDIVQWVWKFGDGQSAQAQTPSHTYSRSGDFAVTLEVRDAKGCTSSAAQAVKVRPAQPSFDVEPATPRRQQLLTFSGVTIDQLTWTWDFGDGTTGVGQTQYHTYKERGVYNVEVRVTNSLGLTSSKRVPLTVFGTPCEECLDRINTATEAQFHLVYDIGDVLSRRLAENRPYAVASCSRQSIRAALEALDQIGPKRSDDIVTFFCGDLL